MTRATDDPRSRIFVGQGHLHQDIPEALVQHVEAFLKSYPSAYAMLEFTSPGPNHRQVDCALVSPGGIDVIEVKRHWGRVTGSADGAWRRSDDKTISNTKRGRSENPYQQAYNIAQDLQKALKKIYAADVRVTPLVFLPHADTRSPIGQDFNVELALGNERRAFKEALRSASRNHGGGWNGADHLDLPARLGLQPMNLAFVQGRVISALDRNGVPEAEVWIEADGQRLQTLTNPAGVYEFAARLGSEVQIGFVVPERFRVPDTFQVRAHQPFVQVEDVSLPERYSRRTEEEVRAEVMRDLQAHTEAQVRQAQAAWDDTQFQMGVVIDDLSGQLRGALMRLAEQERTLQASLSAAAQTPLPLPVQVRQRVDLQVAVSQRAELDGAIRRLQSSPNTEQQDAVQQAIVVLTRVITSQRLELEGPRDASLPVRVMKVTPRLLTPLPAEEVQDIHAEVRAQPAAPRPGQAETQPPSAPSAAPGPVPGLLPVPRSRLVFAALTLAVLLGAGGTAWWVSASKGTGAAPVAAEMVEVTVPPAPPEMETSPEPSSTLFSNDEAYDPEPAGAGQEPDLADLPGVVASADEERPAVDVVSGFEDLPGVPVE